LVELVLNSRTVTEALAGKTAVVVGLARSGVAAAEYLLEHGARVVAADRKAKDELGPEARGLVDRGAHLELGEHNAATYTTADLVVVSPGVRWDLPPLVAARAAGVPVMAELELAARVAEGDIIAVTGTKGKSTTTAAIGAILSAAGRDVRVGGNIGRPAIGLVADTTSKSILVLEVSSFQLEGSTTLHPHVAVFLNLTDDHIDRHGSFAAYQAAKERVFANQTGRDWAVVNAADPRVLEAARRAQARILPFDAVSFDGDGAFFDGAHACLRLDGVTHALFERSDVRLPGAHLALDLLAAAVTATLMGASPADVRNALGGFSGVEHVLERVAEIAGVQFFNDSKATNVDAARRSLEAFDRPVLAIMGGRHKGGDFGLLRTAAQGRVRRILAIGEAREAIARALAPVVPVESCESLRQAVERALSEARERDVVLLAPACASFDMFEDYAHRGRAFKQEVLRLAQERGAH
jgi:UDP-N-acetylmuramoylalanine--D-glutamate ligase